MPYLPIESQLQDTKAVVAVAEANVPPIEMLPEIALLERGEGGRDGIYKGRRVLPSSLPFFRPFSAPLIGAS